jgi:hypothetical protein
MGRFLGMNRVVLLLDQLYLWPHVLLRQLLEVVEVDGPFLVMFDTLDLSIFIGLNLSYVEADEFPSRDGLLSKEAPHFLFYFFLLEMGTDMLASHLFNLFQNKAKLFVNVWNFIGAHGSGFLPTTPRAVNALLDHEIMAF